MNLRLIGIFGLLMANASFAQRTTCGTDKYYQQALANNPGLKEIENQQNAEVQRLAKENTEVNKRATTYIIPVVFHVIHTNGPENISRDQLLDQIRVLNEDYSYTNANKTSLRAAYKSRAGTADIKFQLASIDVNGNCFDGVNRIYSSKGVNMSMTSEPVKYLTNAYWNTPTRKYLNIWVVTDITDGSATGTVLGYAVFPWMSSMRDGIVVRHDRVGTIGTAANSDGGRTLSHEVGHWLGLYHTFQDDCTGGDLCDDTPPVSGTFTNANCPANGNSCHNDAPDLADMWEDYMDYSDGKCMAAFTANQVTRMRSYCAQAPRSNFVSATNLTNTGINAQSVAPVAEFTASARTICAGQSVTFYDLSCKGAPTVTSWTLTGSSTPSSTAKNPTVVYQTPGKYSVSLMSQNASGNNTATKSDYITVLPAVSDGIPNFQEGFESDDPFAAGRLTHSSPGGTQFAINSTGYLSSTGLKAAVTGSNVGGVFSVTTQSFDISKLAGYTPKFTFQCAYVQPSSAVTEIMRIYISTDCGGTFTQIWERSGIGLAYSVSATYQSNFVPSGNTQWKLLGIGSLTSSGYGSAKNAIFRIDVISGGGNPVYIDNINMSPWNAGTNLISKDDVKIELYPNPAKGFANLKLNSINTSFQHCKIQLLDMSGRVVSEVFDGKNVSGNQTFVINHPNNDLFGLYIVSVTTELGTFTKPLIFAAE